MFNVQSVCQHFFIVDNSGAVLCVCVCCGNCVNFASIAINHTQPSPSYIPNGTAQCPMYALHHGELVYYVGILSLIGHTNYPVQ